MAAIATIPPIVPPTMPATGTVDEDEVEVVPSAVVEEDYSYIQEREMVPWKTTRLA